jgi:dipeptidase
MAKGHFERPVSMFRTSYSFVSQSRAHLPDEIGILLFSSSNDIHPNDEYADWCLSI